MRRLLLIMLFLCGGAQAQQPDFVVTLLGTGSPAPVMTRFGPGTLVQVGGQTLLFDAGRGVTQRLMQSRVRLGEADKLFITHLHSDHIVGIPDLWLTGWLEATYAQRKGPFRVFGPAGTAGLMQGLQRAYDWDIKTRIADQGLKPENVAVETIEFKEGVVYDKDGVKVTAFEVDHGALIKPAFGFRVDYGGRSVVISGDTKFNENLIKHATGVVFTRAKPKLAAYYHFVLLGTPAIPPMKEDEVVAMTRKTYAGPLVVGEDLMAFRISTGGVEIVRASQGSK